MRRLFLSPFLSLFFVALASQAQTAEVAVNPDEKLPKPELFRHLSNEVMLPLAQEFAQAAGRLAESAKAFCAAEKASASNLLALRSAWRDAETTWQPMEVAQLGPVVERRTQRQINAWPMRPHLLERLQARGTTVQPAQVEAAGSAGKGFPALEYLLFGPDRSDADVANTLRDKHCGVLPALAAHIKNEADAVTTAWREPDGGYAHQLIEAGKHPQDGIFASADQALSDIANLMIAGLDAVKSRKLGKALEQEDAASTLERLESWRSGTSLDHIRANLRGFELVFFGAGQDGVGLDDYLVGLSRPVLPQLVREDLQAAQNALAAIRPPLRNALAKQRPQVEALHQAIAKLQQRMEDNIAPALKVDLGFNTSDGD
jgi:predicted lipoprotein